ncbi:P-loop containing nucleoside triphosphate hydrolase protein [Baffinella frigidus]|nr:P-loop containing nucleoside triphosphate hydrolase protein [Cryptophyta sp. CCMP2293]
MPSSQKSRSPRKIPAQCDNFSTLASLESCGKMQLLAQWFNDGRNKILLFSTSTRMLDILEKMIQTEGHSYSRLDGSHHTEGHSYSRLDGSTPTATRLVLVEKFNRDKSIFVFLISTRAGGLGLNLTSANKVVVFDPNWNPTHDIQVP